MSHPAAAMRKGLIAKIHVAKKQLALKDDHYRAFLHGVTGKDSCKDMSPPELETVLKGLNKMGFQKKPAPARAGQRKMARGDQARKIRALWLTLYHLGELEDSSEEALCAFGQRMSGVSSLQFMHSHHADAVIKALRGWLTRVGYVHVTAQDIQWIGDESKAHNMALIQRQCEILDIEDFLAWAKENGFITDRLSSLSPEDAMQVIEILGAAVRRKKLR